MRVFTLLLSLFLCTCGPALMAQTTITCGDTFHDPGGPDANYPDGSFEQYVICPTTPGDVVTLEFTMVDLEECCDYVEVYNDGTFTSLRGQVTAPTTFVSSATDGCLSVIFESDFSENEAGFTAVTSCGPPPTCPAPIDILQDGATKTTITISWTETGTATEYDVYIALPGDVPAATPDYDNVGNPFTITGLTVQTGYNVWVRADCDGAAGNDESTVTGPTAVQTAPENDECIDAIAVPLSSFELCNFSTEFFDGGATTSNLPANTCTDTDSEDTWVSFVPASRSVQIFVADGDPDNEGGSRAFEVFSGSCGSLTSLGCEARPTNLTPGATYYIRVTTFGAFFGGETSYLVCVQDQVPPPANDDCETAQPLTVGTEIACTNPTSATTQGANQYSPALCGGTADDDVWFSFTATGPTQLLYLTDIENASGTFGQDLYYEVFTGACGFRVSVVCEQYPSFQNPPVAVTGLTAGTDYLMRVYTDRGASLVDFNICLTSPPVNDQCDGAIPLPVNPTAACDNVVSGSTIGATRSGPDCGIARAEADLWYSFTATRETHLLSALNVDNPNSNFFPQMFYEMSIGGCAGLTVITCESLTRNLVNDLQGLTVGETYYLRVFTQSFTTEANFDLCIGTPPANDECADAVVATVNTDLTNTITTVGTSFGGTKSYEIPQAGASCDPFANDDDVWYRFTAISNEHRVSILNATTIGGNGNETTAIVRIYAADGCAAPVELACGFLSNDGDEETFSNLTPGADYYLAVQSLGTSNDLDFELSIKTENVVLPVELVSFTGRISGKVNRLEWAVEREENFNHYAVERSADGAEEWTELGEVLGAAAGAREGLKSYAFTDEAPLPQGYYRLRSVDLDGTFGLSPVVHIRRSTTADIKLFPNPSNGRFSISLPAAVTVSSVVVYDLTGREVATAISVDGLPVLETGIYQVVVWIGDENRGVRVVVR